MANYIAWDIWGNPVSVSIDMTVASLTVGSEPPITLSDAVQYDQPAAVTVHVYNYGNTTLPAGVEVLLTSSNWSDLDTDSNATSDIKLTQLSIDPGQSEAITFLWTPRLAVQVHELVAIVDPGNLLTGSQDMREDSNRTGRLTEMDLVPSFGFVAAAVWRTSGTPGCALQRPAGVRGRRCRR